ncbi:MAG: hypothetical protein J3R72DRAFT_425891 [Linnemannia gamsii]|nr:MAG: hypothetical protein J3R72DRAFT_425891 [Linnemannia gamsii]
MSSPTQHSQSPCPAPPTSSSSGHSEFTTEGRRAVSQLEKTGTLGCISSKSGSIPSITQGLAAMQLGPANLLNPLGHHVVGYSAYESDAVSVSLEKSSKFRFRKRLSAFSKGHRKAKRAKNAAAIAPPPQAPVRSGNCVHSADSDVEALAVALGPLAPTQVSNAWTTKVTVPAIQPCRSQNSFAQTSRPH